ncbi:hypothetical protein WICPIJ_002653 [Wickerhamomyces pijperi]|uniref:Helicase C-terminal domain-containing protein n=1 Tax=Wickerhamomyces pijperi TaxID=599730 RepID=A0A9P8TPY7_WICPI|nr:hypothetical protein WICPIJ_002653 [Wickerhamomyces pijperi]
MQNSTQTLYHRISIIRNDLNSLIPLGLVYIVNPPLLFSPSLEAPDGWLWMDFSWLDYSYEQQYPSSSSKLSPLLQDLAYLFHRLHIVCTYKSIKINNQVNVIAVKVYVIPSDIQGSRYLAEARLKLGVKMRKSENWHEINYLRCLKNLLSVLDYTEEHWERLTKGEVCQFSGYVVICSGQAATRPSESGGNQTNIVVSTEESNFHVERLLANKAPALFQRTGSAILSPDIDLGLDVRLTEVYNRISFQIPQNSEYLRSLASIKGLKSNLYKYQQESIAKMLHHESPLENNLISLPYFHPIRKCNKTYHFNSQTFQFYNHPEFYHAPRGGILAENMGLGKTLICLALVCHTKDEVACIPEGLIQFEVNDHEVVSLQDQCVRTINRRSIPWRAHKDLLPDNCVKSLLANPGFYYRRREEDAAKLMPNRRLMSRSRPMIQQEKFLLTHSTLIVVPDNLFVQWVQEIQKHIVKDYLTVFTSNDKSIGIPKPHSLISYDIVLVSHSIYSIQDPMTSPFFKIHWKRLIIDEGHSLAAASRSTRIVDLSSQLQVERKWAVTGTPTHGLTNLHMEENSKEKVNVTKKFKPKDDLNRLGHLVMRYFKLEPWCHDRNIWNKGIVKAFVENTAGGVSSLTALLSQLLVRHSTDDIEKDVKLPPLTHTPVYLKPSRHNSIAVNLFVAVLAINAISSERTDQDYMFHPGNKADLRRLVSNLQRASFYWTGFSVDDVQTMITIAQTCLDKKLEGSASDQPYFAAEDRLLLERCVFICEQALKNEIWRIVSTIHEMCFYVSELDDIYYQRYGIGSELNGHSSVFGAPQLYELQQFYFKNRFASGDSLREKIDSDSEKFWKGYWKDLSKKNKDRVKKNDGQPIELFLVSEELDYQKGNHLKMKQQNEVKYNDPNAVKDRSTGRLIATVSTHSNNSQLNAFGSLNATIQGTASAKLSYMVTQLLNNKSTGTKSIVFYEFEDMAYYLSESLDVLGLPYLLYSTSIATPMRSEKIDQFSSTQGSCTLIMDLKLASHGLTIIAATKVYFLCPVWKRSMEAQAIKRAHRIGQRHTVHVETLILEGSLEEEMFRQRRHADLKQEGGTVLEEKESSGVVEDNEQVRDHILKFQFLQESMATDEVPYSKFECSSSVNNENCESLTLKAMNSDNVDQYQLPEAHVVRKDNTNLEWWVPLFNKDSQMKVAGLTSNYTEQIDPNRLKKRSTMGKEKRKVTFISPLVSVSDDLKVTIKMKSPTSVHPNNNK